MWTEPERETGTGRVPLRCPIGRRYLADQEGGLLVLFALSLAIIFGFMALVFDIGRTVGTASELQSYADHIALVAAGELDREPGAIAAAEALVASGDFDDFQTFASDDPGLGADDVTLTFYRSIPDDDGAPLTDVTTDDAEASFVQVVIRPHTVTNLFAGVVNALTGSDIGASVVSAAAVAGRDRQACGITPLVMCAPAGGSYDPVPGRMIHLRSGIRWEPGEFGVLADNFEPGSDCGNFGTAGSAVVECVLGITPSVGRCYAASGLTIVNGLDDDEIAAGLNVRFDIYREALRNDEDDPRFAPAPNVAKGFGPESGNCIDDYDVTDFTSFPTPFFERSIPLPRDACFNLAGICNLTASNIGTGISDLLLDIYWFLNHGTARPPAGSRFELYQQEILNPPAADRLLEEPRQETGLATCYANGAVPTPAGPERRLVTAAVINCDGDQGLPNQGLVQNVPALKFVQLFMTEPADSRIGGNVVSAWFEEVGEVVPGTPGLDGASVHDVVQLYRWVRRAMIGLISRYAKDQAGGPFAEMAVLLLPFVLMVAMVIEGGNLLWRHQAAHKSVATAARFLSRVGPLIDPLNCQIVTPVLNQTRAKVKKLAVTGILDGSGSLIPGFNVGAVDIPRPAILEDDPCTVLIEVAASVDLPVPFAPLFRIFDPDAPATISFTVADRARWLGE